MLDFFRSVTYIIVDLTQLPLKTEYVYFYLDIFIYKFKLHYHFKEYTYKKITPCDVCSQILRGKQ